MVQKGIFSETVYVCVFTNQFQVSITILTSFRQDGGWGVILPAPIPPCSLQNEPLKNPPRLGLICAEDRHSNPYKIYFGKDAFDKFLNMISKQKNVSKKIPVVFHDLQN